MPAFGKFNQLDFDDGFGQPIDEATKDEEHRVLKLADSEGAKSQAFRFSDYAKTLYEDNVVDAEMFQDNTEFSVAGGSSASISADTTNVKIGKQSTKLTETDNVAGLISMSKGSFYLSLTGFPSGNSSTTDDIITFSVYVSDYTKFTEVGIAIGSSVGHKYYTSFTPAKSGWNTFFTKKSNFSVTGSPSWGFIGYLEAYGTTVINSINEYLSFQQISMIRNDPIDDGYPSAFQLYYSASTGYENIFESYYDTWNLYFDPHKRRIGMQRLDTLSHSNSNAALKIHEDVISFIGKFEMNMVDEDDGGSITWKYDNNNYIEVTIDNQELQLDVCEAGVVSSQTANAFFQDIQVGDCYYIQFEKDLDYVRVFIVAGGSPVVELVDEISISTSLAGDIYFGSYSSNSMSFITDFVISNSRGYKLDTWDKPRVIIKKEDESVSSSTTLQNDNDLKILLPPRCLFEIEALLSVDSASATPNFKKAWDLDSVMGTLEEVEGKIFGIGPGLSLSGNYENSDYVSLRRYNATYSALYGLSSVGAGCIMERMLIDTGLYGGILTLQWCQNTSNATAVTVEAGSYLKITKVKA